MSEHRDGILSRRTLLRRLAWAGGVMVGVAALPAHFWRRWAGTGPRTEGSGRAREVEPDVASRIRQRARPFEPHTLNEPHDLAG